MIKLANRMSNLGTETAFEVLVKARALEAQGRDIIHLEVGEPDFATPENIVDAAVESLAGVDRSVLMTRNNVLQRTIEEQNARLVSFNTRLDRERERLLVYFYNLELAISKMKANLSVVEALAPMPLMIGRNTTTN